MSLSLPVIDAVNRGWSVIPVDANKKPYFSWKDFQGRRATLEELHRWNEQYHPSGWAVITGAISDLVILDFDGEKGQATREQLGLDAHVRTGSGGSHVYFNHPRRHVSTLNHKSKKALNDLYPGLDIRGDGGYAVFCSRNTQGEYEQLRELIPERVDALPADLREMLGLVTPARAVVRAHSVGVADPQRVSVSTLLDRAVGSASLAGRNNAGFWLATQLRDNGYSELDARSAMSDYTSRVSSVNTKGLPEPYTQAEAMASLHQAYDTAPREPWNKRGVDALRIASPQDADQYAPKSMPKIDITDRRLPDMSSQAIEALDEKNEPPEIFVRGGRLCRFLVDENGRPSIQSMNENEVRHFMARSADWLKFDRRRSEYVPTAPPIAVVRDVIAQGHWPFPALEGIVEVPVLRPDGTMLDSAGYDPISKLFYLPEDGLRIPAIPSHPTDADLKGALETIEDAIGQFPFVDQPSRANALALLLSPIIRPAIAGNIPLALIDAPDAGTGKGLFADVISIIATGRSGGFMTAPTEDEEWRKQITSTLHRGQTIITIDNVEGTLDSPSLASALTSQVWQDRILGRTEMVTIPQRATWIVTGNNIQLGGDIPRRCYWIRLDAKVERPWERDGWRHPDLREWVSRQRGQLLTALLILARAHYAISLMPAYSGPVIGSFEPWCRTTGGILIRANVEGFLGNLQEMYTTSDEERPQWEAFFGTLEMHYRGKDFIVADLIRGLDSSPSLRESLPYDLADIYHGSRWKIRQSLGKALSRHKDAQHGQWRLVRAGEDTHSKVAKWRVVAVPVGQRRPAA